MICWSEYFLCFRRVSGDFTYRHDHCLGLFRNVIFDVTIIVVVIIYITDEKLAQITLLIHHFLVPFHRELVITEHGHDAASANARLVLVLYATEVAQGELLLML